MTNPRQQTNSKRQPPAEPGDANPYAAPSEELAAPAARKSHAANEVADRLAARRKGLVILGILRAAGGMLLFVTCFYLNRLAIVAAILGPVNIVVGVALADCRQWARHVTICEALVQLVIAVALISVATGNNSGAGMEDLILGVCACVWNTRFLRMIVSPLSYTVCDHKPTKKETEDGEKVTAETTTSPWLIVGIIGVIVFGAVGATLSTGVLFRLDALLG